MVVDIVDDARRRRVFQPRRLPTCCRGQATTKKAIKTDFLHHPAGPPSTARVARPRCITPRPAASAHRFLFPDSPIPSVSWSLPHQYRLVIAGGAGPDRPPSSQSTAPRTSSSRASPMMRATTSPLLIENHASRHDVAQSEAVHRVGVGVVPGFQPNMQPVQHRRNLGAVLRLINRDQHEAHRLAGSASSRPASPAAAALPGTARTTSPRNSPPPPGRAATESFRVCPFERLECRIGRTFRAAPAPPRPQTQRPTAEQRDDPDSRHSFPTIQSAPRAFLHRKVDARLHPPHQDVTP